MSYLASRGTDAVKVWFIVRDEAELPALASAVRAAGEAATERGVPLIVHATGLAEAKEAVRAGAKLLVHSVWDRPVDQELIDLLLEQGTIYCPTLTVTQGYLRLAEAVASNTVPEIDDPNGCVAAETRARVAATAQIDSSEIDASALDRRRRAVAERGRIGAANLATLAAAGVPVAMGTDAGNPLTLHGPSVYAELEAMEAAGLSPMAVLISATATAAQAMGRAADLGTVEPGKIADLLVLSADPTLSTTAFRSLTHVTRAGVLRPTSELLPLHTARAPEQP